MQIKDRQQLLTILAIAAVTLFLGDKVVFTPLTHFWQNRSAQIADLRKRVSSGDRLLQREQSLRRRWAEMQTNGLPHNLTIAEQTVSKAIYNWGGDSQISITGLAPQWKKASNTQDGSDNNNYMTLQCRVDAFGSMATLSRFLYDLEHTSLPLRLQAVDIGSRNNTGQQLNLGLQVSGLVLNPQTQ